MFNIIPDTLVIGIDKWHLENLINDNFFWFGHPFEKSRAKGFIFTEKPFETVIPFTIVVDLEESSHLKPVMATQKMKPIITWIEPACFITTTYLIPFYRIKSA